MGGATIHSRYNFTAQVEVVLMLSIPPIHAGGRPHQLRIRARTTYTVLDGSLNLFRTGVQFLELAPHDHKVLEANLESRFSAFQLGGADKVPAMAGR